MIESSKQFTKRQELINCCCLKPWVLLYTEKTANLMKRRFLCFGFFFFVFLSFFLGPYPWYMEVPRLGVQLELQLPAYTTAHGSAILNPLSKAGDQTLDLKVPSQIHFLCTTMGTPKVSLHTTILYLILESLNA